MEFTTAKATESIKSVLRRRVRHVTSVPIKSFYVKLINTVLFELEYYLEIGKLTEKCSHSVDAKLTKKFSRCKDVK